MREGPVLVTGAAGFLGRTVCADLLAHGIPVRAMVRGNGNAIPGAESVRADLTDAPSIQEAVKGVSVIVHLAARVHVMKEKDPNPDRAYRLINVEGTRNLLSAAAAAGVERFVFISSVKAVGDHSTLPLTAATPPTPVDAYGKSKLEAEAVVRGASAQNRMRTTTLRLPLVYGPHMGANMLRLFHTVRRRIPLPLGAIFNARSMVYSGNVAAAIRHVIQLESPPPGPLFVADYGDLSTPDLLRSVGNFLGSRPPLIPIPPLLLRLTAQLSAPGTLIGLPDLRPTIDRLTTSLQIDSRELERATGFVPPFSTEEGLRATAKWFLEASAA